MRLFLCTITKSKIQIYLPIFHLALNFLITTIKKVELHISLNEMPYTYLLPFGGITSFISNRLENNIL